MIRPLTTIALAIGSAAMAHPASIARCVEGLEPSGPDSVYAALAGKWAGILEYEDAVTGKRVRLPTTLEVRPIGDPKSIRLQFRYDEGNGRFVESVESIRIDEAAGTFVQESAENGSRTEYAISGLDTFDPRRGGTLRLTGRGTVTETIIVEKDRFLIVKQTRTSAGSYTLRSQYSFKRIGAASP